MLLSDNVFFKFTFCSTNFTILSLLWWKSSPWSYYFSYLSAVNTIIIKKKSAVYILFFSRPTLDSSVSLSILIVVCPSTPRTSLTSTEANVELRCLPISSLLLTTLTATCCKVSWHPVDLIQKKWKNTNTNFTNLRETSPQYSKMCRTIEYFSSLYKLHHFLWYVQVTMLKISNLISISDRENQSLLITWVCNKY